MTPFQAQIPVLPEVTSESHKKRRFLAEGTPLQQIEHRVNPINLDFNGHVNNRTYLSIAMQSADEAFMDTHAIRCLAIHWLKESFLGDTLTSRLSLLPNEADETVYHYLHTISRNDAETAAQVYSEWIPRTEQIDVSVPKITICILVSPFAHNKNEYSYETASNWYRRNGFGHLVQG